MNKLITTRSYTPHKLYGQVIPGRSHGNQEIIARRQQFLRRRVGATVLGFTVGIGAFTATDKLIDAATNENHYIVDRHAVMELDPETRDDKYVKIMIGHNDSLSTVTHDYVELHGGNEMDIIEALKIQARQIDIDAGRSMNDHIILPGEEYYLPRD